MSAASIAKLGSGVQGLAIGAAVLAVVGVVAYVLLRGAKGTGQDAGEAVGGLVGGAVRGTVRGLTSGLGLPVPDQAKCDAAIASGAVFDRINYCPIDRFFESAPDESEAAASDYDYPAF